MQHTFDGGLILRAEPTLQGWTPQEVIAQAKRETVPVPRAVEPAIGGRTCQRANQEVRGFVDDYPAHGGDLENMGLAH